MLYMITLNPALDIAGTVDRLIANEKNYVFEEIRSAGGNGINAARIAHRMGVGVVASGFLGGPTGDEVKKLLDEEKIKNQFVQIDANTRINIIVSDRSTHSQTRLNFPGGNIKRRDIKKLHNFCNQLKRKSLVVIGGSLPKWVSPKDIGLLLLEFRRRNHFCIVDMPGSCLGKIVSYGPSLIKPNLREFQELTGKNVRSLPSVLNLARQLTKIVPLVCVSSVEGGALLVTKNKAWFGKIPKVKVRSTVGAGDSMVGAMSAALWRNNIQNIKSDKMGIFLDENGSDILRWGLAAACATLTEPGMSMGDRSSILKYYPMVDIKEMAEPKRRKSNGKK